MSLYDNKSFSDLDKNELLELSDSYISEGKYNLNGDLYTFEDYLNHHYGYGYEFTKKDVLDWWESQMFCEHILEDHYEYNYL